MDNIYLQKVLEGDISKFSYFIDKYSDMAFSIAYRIINNREDAEEIVQDSFLRAFKSLAKFRSDSKFSTWFYRIVVNNSLTKQSRDKKDTIEIDLDKVSDSIIENVDSIYSDLTKADQQKFINSSLIELCIEDRLLLTLYYLNENSIEEITEITNISQQTLKMKIHRARKKMYVVLEKIKIRNSQPVVMDNSNLDKLTKAVLKNSMLEITNPDFNKLLMKRIRFESRKKTILHNIGSFLFIFITLDALIFSLFKILKISIASIYLELDTLVHAISFSIQNDFSIIGYFLFTYFLVLAIVLFISGKILNSPYKYSST